MSLVGLLTSLKSLKPVACVSLLQSSGFSQEPPFLLQSVILTLIKGLRLNFVLSKIKTKIAGS